MVNVHVEAIQGYIVMDMTMFEDVKHEEIVVSTHRFFEDDDAYVSIRGIIEDKDGNAGHFSVNLSPEEAKELASEIVKAANRDPEAIVKRHDQD